MCVTKDPKKSFCEVLSKRKGRLESFDPVIVRQYEEKPNRWRVNHHQSISIYNLLSCLLFFLLFYIVFYYPLVMFFLLKYYYKNCVF